MALSAKQRHYLRGLAHHRKAVIILGSAGLTPAVVREIEQALDRHELLKIKINNGDRPQRQALVARLCELTAAESLQEIGRMAVLYRRGPEPRLILPDLPPAAARHP